MVVASRHRRLIDGCRVLMRVEYGIVELLELWLKRWKASPMWLCRIGVCRLMKRYKLLAEPAP